LIVHQLRVLLSVLALGYCICVLVEEGFECHHNVIALFVTYILSIPHRAGTVGKRKLFEKRQFRGQIVPGPRENNGAETKQNVGLGKRK
jgi:hypothetical protein